MIDKEKLNDLLLRLGSDVSSLLINARNIGNDYNQLVMMLNPKGAHREPMSIYDRVLLEHFDRDGNLIGMRDSGWSPNGITNVGFAEVAGLLLTDVGGTPFDYIAIGEGTTAFSPTQTALVSEVIRKSGTGTRVTGVVTNDTAQLVTTFSSANGLSGSDAITESGVFNASSGGTMLCRQVFDVLNINWDAGDSLQVTWRIRIQQGS